ncbi:HWE histidine kinase domain-containing protein [Thioclava sp. GXIMD2076]|uniref:sensor histidine kinase n=1 Tax=unclassified Thioclava TaxID=2621713 RepID=UPI0030D22AE2
MSDVIAAFDWTSTPLGPIHQWQPELRTAVSMMLASNFPKAIVWGPERITIHNSAFTPILGEKGLGIGRGFHEIWSEAWAEIGPIWERAMAGEATFIEDFKLRIERNGYPEDAHFTFCYSPIRAENGQVLGMLDTVVETSKSVDAMAQAEVANAELGHRMRNMITIISSMARHSLRGSPEIEAMSRAFCERLAALSEAQSLLAHGAKNATTVEALVKRICDGRVVTADALVMSGPPVVIGSRQATALSLAVNELITNAMKYGALSVENGKVSVDWGIEGEEFVFAWGERDGPPVAAPERSGFGSKLLERIVPASFIGKASVTYAPEGTRYVLRSSRQTLE